MDSEELSSPEPVGSPRADSTTNDGTDSHKRHSFHTPSPPPKRAREDDGPVHILKGSGDESYDESYSLDKAWRPATIEELRRAMRAWASRGSIFIVHGLPVDYTRAIKEEFRIDRAFIEAHTERTGFRPMFMDWETTWGHWEYPELVVEQSEERQGEARRTSCPDGSLDVMSKPVVREVGRDGISAMFCRVSVWKPWNDAFLFLEKQYWKEDSSPLTKARKKPSVTRLNNLFPDDPSHVPDICSAGGDEMPSLEDELLAMVEHESIMGEGLMEVISRLVYRRWIDLFEMLPPPEMWPTNNSKLHALIWEMIHALEKNVDMARYLSRARGTTFRITLEDWERLVARARSRLGTVVHTNSPVMGVCPRPAPESINIPVRGTIASGGNPGRNNSTTYGENIRDSDKEEINKRSLDRVTYLGGLLLPITVVSSILAIEGSYGPEGDAFWVFWVAAVISSAVCIFIIYLDQLRGLDFWVEISASDAVEAMMRRQPTKTFNPEESDVGGSLAGEYAGENGDTLRVGVGEGVGGRPVIWLQRSHDGHGDRAWRRDRLGWGGACKKALGYYYLKGGKVRFDRPDRERVY